jgi:hypothetical protein
MARAERGRDIVATGKDKMKDGCVAEADKIMDEKLGMVVHVCNLSYSGGRRRMIKSFRLAQAKLG